MVFLFIFLGIIILFITAKIRIEIEDLRFLSNILKNENLNNITHKQEKQNFLSNHFNDKYNIKIKFIILGKIPILWSNINKEKIQKLKENEKFKSVNINLKNIKKEVSLKQINQINICIEKFYLKAEIGTESTMLTTMIVPIISTFWAIILTNKKVKKSNQKYQIKPIYNSGNVLKLEFSGVFEMKNRSIIKTLIEIVKMRNSKGKRK